MFDVSKAFDNSSEIVADFFQRPGVGFYIPLYQREYSWNKENIEQLMGDICQGLMALSDGDQKSIHFLGTVITVLEKDPQNNIKPQDRRALPEKIFNVIDGQQRISTLVILACLLFQKIENLLAKIKRSKQLEEKIIESLDEACQSYQIILKEMFSVDLKRGKPRDKPIIIRGSIDGWTFDGDLSHYKSDIAAYTASLISHIHSEGETPIATFNEDSLVGLNIKKINSHLLQIEQAYLENNSDFLAAWKILQTLDEKFLWSYERLELKTWILSLDKDNLSNVEKTACSIVQILAFSYFLLNRCCFTLIEPKSEEWAFDMFQSLNATGTPLTAIETFKPLVVNYNQSKGLEFKTSKSQKYYNDVDSIFTNITKEKDKNNATDSYLTLLGLVHNGGKDPSRRFSSQRKWLSEQYNNCPDADSKEEFLHRMSDVAIYWKDIWNLDIETLYRSFDIHEVKVEQSLLHEAAVSIMYLKEANHFMANTILCRFYSQYLRNKKTKKWAVEFLEVCKVISAFYTIWRSALKNTGLDKVYRELLSRKMSFEKGDEFLNIAEVKLHFLDALEERNIHTKDRWFNRAKEYLKYSNAKPVCKFSLFVVSHDTKPDEENLPLMKLAKKDSAVYLEPERWQKLKTVEHIAPRKPLCDSEWDKNLYVNDEYELIGNLTLLPARINSSASNKEWLEKWIYYQYLAENDLEKISLFEDLAHEYGIELAQSTINLLKDSPYSTHIDPIRKMSRDVEWDQRIVQMRTERICDIVWQRMHDEWLSLKVEES